MESSYESHAVRADAFEPSTSWSRTGAQIYLSRWISVPPVQIPWSQLGQKAQSKWPMSWYVKRGARLISQEILAVVPTHTPYPTCPTQLRASSF